MKLSSSPLTTDEIPMQPDAIRRCRSSPNDVRMFQSTGPIKNHGATRGHDTTDMTMHARLVFDPFRHSTCLFGLVSTRSRPTPTFSYELSFRGLG
jgi:hypothetical protein